MLVDGRDLASDGFDLIKLSGIYRGPEVRRDSSAAPDTAGQFVGIRQTVGPRDIQCVYRCQLTALAQRQAKITTLQDRLGGLLTLRFSDWTDRIVRAVCTSFVPAPPDDPDNIYAVSTLDIAVTLTAYNAASYSAEPRIVALTTSPANVQLGTLPSVGIIQLAGAWTSSTSRTITIRNAAGQVVSSMALTAPSTDSLSSSEFLEVDTVRRYITKVSATGVRTNAYSWKPSGAFVVLDNVGGDRANSRYVTAEVSTGTAVLIYRLAYGL